MVPRSILQGLAGLRRRERLLQLTWAGARVIALAAGLLLLGGALDWLVDRDRDTPLELRIGVLFVQLALIGAAAGLAVLPLLRSLPDDELALRVEEKNPKLQQRLISAVQLNQEGANTEGMSPGLIAQVTREAEKQAEQIPFAGLADHSRLPWSAAVVAPMLILFALPFLFWPDLASTLLARQFLADRDIPRTIRLENITAKVFPQGEKVLLRFRVHGPHLTSDFVGDVRVKPEGQPRDRYDLKLDDKTPLTDGAAVYVAQLPGSAVNFTFRAWLGDGRSRESKVIFVPLPEVDKDPLAYVQLPAFCGLRPNGTRYEELQPRGDVVGIAGSTAEIVARLKKPVKKATLILIHRTDADEQTPAKDVVLSHKDMFLSGDVQHAVATFDLQADPKQLQPNAYEIELVDEYDFVNKPRPRRAIRVVPEEPPQVALLKEQFPPKLLEILGVDAADDAVVEGIPVLLGAKIRIPYQCVGPYGLGQARILYRMLKKTESGNDVVKENPWTILPLGEVKAGPESGPFDPRKGAFENSPFLESIPFHAIPSPNPDKKLGRTQGGGRYDLDTNGLVDAAGKLISVNLGNQIEYKVQVFADKDGKTSRPYNESETRVKTIVSLLELTRWMEDTTREEQAIRSLDKKQRGLFEKLPK